MQQCSSAPVQPFHGSLASARGVVAEHVECFGGCDAAHAAEQQRVRGQLLLLMRDPHPAARPLPASVPVPRPTPRRLARLQLQCAIKECSRGPAKGRTRMTMQANCSRHAGASGSSRRAAPEPRLHPWASISRLEAEASDAPGGVEVKVGVGAGSHLGGTRPRHQPVLAGAAEVGREGSIQARQQQGERGLGA